MPAFFAVSFVYSSVGFGGGSSYIAILAFSGVSIVTVPTIALPLNIAVSSITFFNYLRAGHFSLKFSLPFLASIPFAFYAGTLNFDESTLAIIFVIALLASSFVLFTSSYSIKKRQQETDSRNLSSRKLIFIGIPIGSVLGSIAGLVGIGGGIWLSPLLILSRLSVPKRAAATASFFILTNSISGFTGHAFTKPVNLEFVLPLLIVIMIGGFFGSRFGAFKIDHNVIRIIVGVIVAAAALNIVYSNWFNYQS
ncbi:MAG: sulfite exporter TauE/SafE family protein [Nitrosopumilus sp.]